MTIAVGTTLLHLEIRDPLDGRMKFGEIWKVISTSSRGWTIQLVDIGPNNYSRGIGHIAEVTEDWIDANCRIISTPSLPAPTGDGMMFAAIRDINNAVIATRQWDGPADELMGWLYGQLGENLHSTAEWWGFDAQLYDDDGNITGIDNLPDMVATLDGEALVWAET